MAWVLFLNAGCNQERAGTGPAVTSAEYDPERGEARHSLHGYWCVEHGLPEEICARCNTTLAAEFQEKGDWCVAHNRPDSQCFIHHPELESKFIAQYEAKFGEKPPARKE
jgi:cobalt-zinc-cadmium efflux system membrane fusion protein